MIIKAEIYLDFDPEKWQDDMDSIGYSRKSGDYYLKQTQKLVSMLDALPTSVYDVELVKYDCKILNPEEMFDD